MGTGKEPIPFLLSPIGKDYIWGGERLNKEFGKKLNVHPLAETWECSTHPDGLSIVASGEYAGMTLKEVLKRNPEYIGKYANAEGELPILVKLIDAQQNLSVQVHPDDRYAKIYENGQSGKNEMWYVLDAEPQAQLIYGFTQQLTKQEIKSYLENGIIESFLQKVSVKKGDSFYIEAGTVHAIGAGVLIAEIQENSNLTYRLYDYNRNDSNGNKRELHIEKALDVINLNIIGNTNLRKCSGKSSFERICNCPYFKVDKIQIEKGSVTLDNQQDAFHILLCINGNGKLKYSRTESLTFSKGDCIFIPINSRVINLVENAEILDVYV